MTKGPRLPVLTLVAIRTSSEELDPCDDDATPEGDFDIFWGMPGFAGWPPPPIGLVWNVSSGG